MRRLRGAILWAVLAAAALAGGCGRTEAVVRSMAGGPDEAVPYDTAVCQLARDRKVQLILLRRTAAPIGKADPDFEYVFLELPEDPKYGWLRQDGVPAYRWVHERGENRIWLASSGQVRLRSGDRKRHFHLDFRMTMEPVAGTPGGPYVFSGNLKFAEDLVQAQGLVNRYGTWLGSLLKGSGAEAK